MENVCLQFSFEAHMLFAWVPVLKTVKQTSLWTSATKICNKNTTGGINFGPVLKIANNDTK